MKKWKNNTGWLLFLCVIACASFPPRDFEVSLYEIDLEEGCIYRKDEVWCAGDPDIPLVIGISPQDYTKERNYQQDIIDACGQWK